MDKEKMKAEAIARMKTLDLHPNVIKDFETEGKLNRSDHHSNMGGILYWLNEEEKEIVKKVEKKTGGIVYHLIHTPTDFGELYSVLYVSTEEVEWVMDRNDIKDNRVFTYVENVTDENMSEFGTIGIQSINGGLIRTA